MNRLRNILRSILSSLSLGEGRGEAFVVLLLCLTSCTKATMESLPDKSSVIVRLDWSGEEEPAGTKFYFYPAEGETVGLVQEDAPSAGYWGELPLGRYDLLAYNTGTVGTTFSGMESYSTATVSADPVATRADGITLISQPSPLYAGTVAGGLDVVRFETVEKNVTPKLLTRTLKLTFDTSKLDGVNFLEGELRGLYSAVLLSTGEATEAVRKQAPQVGTPFDTPIISGGASVKISFFGLLNPENGSSYKNEMPITLKGADGWEQSTTVDLTKVLTDIASQAPEGEFEFEVEDDIKINVEPTPTGLFASVVSWTRYGEGEGEIFYIIY